MKKIISLVLALALCMALAAPAFAEGISGDEYAEEAELSLEQGQALAAATLFELAAQAYEEAGDEEAALGAYSAAGGAYESTGKSDDALRAYLAAKEYGKAAELLLSENTEEPSGDDYLNVAAALVEQGVPESELAYLYKKAAEAIFAEANAEVNDTKALSLLQKAQALADKHGDAELAAEIDAAAEVLKERIDEFEKNLLAIATVEDAVDFVTSFSDLLEEMFGLRGYEVTRAFDRIGPYFEIAIEYLRLHGYNYLALSLCYEGVIYAAPNTGSGVVTPGSQCYAFFEKMLECEEPAVSQLTEDGKYFIICTLYKQIALVYMLYLGDTDSAATYLKKGVSFLEKETQAMLNSGKWDELAGSYDAIATFYQVYLNDEESAAACIAKAEKIRAEYDPDMNPTGSVLSEGSLTVIVGVAAAAVFGLGGFMLGKKKKPALANGAGSEDDE